MISVCAVSACTKDTNKTTNTVSNTGVYILSNKAGNVRKRNDEERSRNHYCRGKAIRITYSECVSVALGIQHAMHMPHVILPSVACPALQYFSTLFRKRSDFRKNTIEQKVCFDFLCNFCLKHLSF